MKLSATTHTSLCAALVFCGASVAQEVKPARSVLITSARIFDGQNEKLAEEMSVLVEGKKRSRRWPGPSRLPPAPR